MVSHAPISKYFKVVSLQHSEDLSMVSEREMLLGYAENEDGMIRYTNPDMPLKNVYWVKPWDGSNMDVNDIEYFYKPFDGAIRMEILNHDLEKKDQKWTRPVLPAYWTLSYLTETAIRNKWTIRRSGKVIPDLDKFRDANNLTDEQYDFAVREWHRRIYGVWIWINGALTHLTGFNYYYLTYFKIDTGYPGYRDRDRRWFYVAQAVTDSEDCLGLVYLKHRRDGATYRCCCLGLETATRGHLPEANFGIMSKDDDSAKDAFKKKTVNPFQAMPFFFTPMVKDKTDVEKTLEFKAPPRSISERHLADQTGLGATIEYKAKGKKGVAGFDCAKLHFLLMDEVGKKKDVSVMGELGLVTPTMDLDGIYGKIFAATTNEELDGENKEEFRKMWDRSDPAMMLTSNNGETKTKLWRYFTPAYDGLHFAWIGPFGESIIDAPTEEQMEYLMSLGRKHVKKWERHWRRGGAYAYLVRERADKTGAVGNSSIDEDDEDDNSLSGFIRRYPFTPEESFTETNPSSDYNLENINRVLRELGSITATGNSLFGDLTIRGNLEWVDHFKGDVKFVPHKDGRFLFNKNYMPGGKFAEELGIVANAVQRGNPRQGVAEEVGIVRPGRNSMIFLGCDPQKTADVDRKAGKSYSQAATHAFYPYNFEVEKVAWDPQIETDPEFAKGWKSHAFIVEYLRYPKDPREHHTDTLKLCLFLNAKVLFERQLTDLGHYFRRIGCGSFLVTDSAWIKNPDNAVPGIHSSEDVISMYKARTKAFIEYHCYAQRCPFPQTLGQWASFKGDNIGKLDAQVSSGLALLAEQPGPIRKTQKKTDIAQENKKGAPESGVSSLMRLYA